MLHMNAEKHILFLNSRTMLSFLGLLCRISQLLFENLIQRTVFKWTNKNKGQLCELKWECWLQLDFKVHIDTPTIPQFTLSIVCIEICWNLCMCLFSSTCPTDRHNRQKPLIHTKEQMKPAWQNTSRVQIEINTHQNMMV